jgi:Flp pilus assembly protein TadD
MFRKVIIIILALSSGVSLAQRRPGATGRGSGGAEISVRILYDNSRPAGELLRVQLMTQTSMPVAELFTDSRGEARFAGVRPGVYRAKVTGIGIEETLSDSFEITPADMANFQMVTVKRTAEAIASAKTAAAPISAAELNIPDKARRSFDKGVESIGKGKTDEAMKHLSKATEIYPKYAAAFDAMGVAIVASSPGEAKTYFTKAIEADKQFYRAYAHLARSNMAENNWAEAERLLLLAVPINPRSAESLFLLAYAEARLGKYEQALDAVRRTHQLEHADFALVHFVGAEAFAHAGRTEEAVSEYQTYLREAPLGKSADVAKRNISALQARRAAK